MSRITRYILRQLAAPTVLILFTLTGVVWLTQSLRFIDKIVANGLSVSAFLQFTSLLAPRVISLVLPIALFLAILYTYHRLRSDSELIVMSAAGLSKQALARPALILAAFVTVVGYVLGLYIAPLAHRTFKDQQDQLRSDVAAILLQEGTFNNLSNGLTVYVRERKPDGEMLGILVHDNRNRSRPVTMMAESGALVATPEGPRFVMVNGNRQQVDKEKGGLSLLYFDSYSLDLSLYAGKKSNRWRSAGERYLPGLLWPQDQGLDDKTLRKLVLEAHRRLTTPLNTLVLALIALSATLAGEFSRRGLGRRIVLAAAAAITYQTGIMGLTILADKQIYLIPLLYLYIAVAFAAALYVLLHHPRKTRGTVVRAKAMEPA